VYLLLTDVEVIGDVLTMDRLYCKHILQCQCSTVLLLNRKVKAELMAVYLMLLFLLWVPLFH